MISSRIKEITYGFCSIFLTTNIFAEVLFLNSTKISLPHKGGVRGIKADSDDFLLSWGNDEAVRIVDLNSNNELFSLPIKLIGNSFDFDTTENKFEWINGGEKYYYQLSTKPNLFARGKKIEFPDDITTAHINSSIGKIIFSSKQDIFLFDTSNGVSKKLCNAPIGTYQIILNNKSDYFVVSYEVEKPDRKNQTYIWNVEYKSTVTGETIHSFQGHRDWVRDMEFSIDDKYVYTSTGNYWGYRIVDGFSEFVNDPPSKDSALRVWDVSTGQLVTKIQYDNPVEFMDVSSDGALIAITISSEVHLIDSKSFSTLAVLKGLPSRLSAVQFAANKKYIYAGSFDGYLASWDISTVNKFVENK